MLPGAAPADVTSGPAAASFARRVTVPFAYSLAVLEAPGYGSVYGTAINDAGQAVGYARAGRAPPRPRRCSGTAPG